MYFYCLFDKKLERFNLPFNCDDDKLAIASVRREIEIGSGVISKAPWDFILYRVFTFDNVSGVVVPQLDRLFDFAEVYHNDSHV